MARSKPETKLDNDGRILRKCTNCEEFKLLDCFSRKATGSFGTSAVCRECDTAKAKRWYENNLEHSRAYKRNWQSKKLYGISYTEHQTLLQQKCAICATVEDMHLDHDHETGEIRGALCSNCNRGLGCFKDNVELLLGAAAYLEQRKKVSK